MTEISNRHPGIRIPGTVEMGHPETGHHSFEVEIDGTKTIEQLIRLGGYDLINSEINENNFPIVNKTKRISIIEVFTFSKLIPFTEVMIRMKRGDCRPITIEELLALGIKDPELQKHTNIISLGSVFKDMHQEFRVPILSSDGPKRKLDHVVRHSGFHSFGAICNIT